MEQSQTTMTMTTTTFEPQTKDKEIHSSALSVTSNTSCTLVESTSFCPSRILTVNARGIAAFRLPLPSRQTEIFIYNPDGTEAYVSTRDNRWSGNAVLCHPKRGSIIRTEYFFGPGRDPLVQLLQTADHQQEVTVSGKWTSRTMRFTMPGGTPFEWRYAKEKRADGQKVNLIVLCAVEGKDQASKGNRIAQLVRGHDARTPGTKRCSAGNGGELQIDDALTQSLELDEAIIVATCLMMLKREIDRRRMIQCAVIAGAAGS